MSKYKNIFAKGYVPNSSEEVFAIKKVKNTVPWTYVISDPKGEEIVGTFYKKVLQKKNQSEFRVEKEMKRKGDKLYVTWKGYNSSFSSWIDINGINEWVFSRRVKVELDLSNYATKTELKNATGGDASSFANKTDLANLKSDLDNLDIDKLRNIPTNLSNFKSKVDKLDVDELVSVPVDLSKLSNIVRKYVA